MRSFKMAAIPGLLVCAAAIGGCAVTDGRIGNEAQVHAMAGAAGSGQKDSALEPAILPARWISIPRSNLKPRHDWFLLQRTYPVGAIPENALEKAMRQRDLVPEDKSRHFASPSADGKVTATSAFTSVGPAGFTSTVAPLWGAMSGRVRDIAIDPTNPARIFIASATGGIWRTTNGGTSWTPLTDTQDSLSGSAVAIDPQNVNTIYAGTGEGPGGAYYGIGILKSTDGGATWTVNARSTFARHSISRILVSPTDSNVVLVCSTSGSHQPGNGIVANPGSIGVFRSIDGGVTFTQTSAGQFCQSLIADPANFSNLYASLTGNQNATDGLYKSTNGGVSFTQLGGGAPTGVDRIALGISADGATLYGGGKDGGTTKIWKSTDAGATWTAIAGAPDYCEKQCGYDNAIAVAPNNANVAFFGGVPMYRTMDGGTTFVQLGDNNDTTTRPLHVDHHVLKFATGSSTTLYVGNDGGIYVSTDAQATLPAWNSIGGTLATLQPYNVALHPTNAGIMLSGFQDNGTELRSGGNVWSEKCGGDGGVALIDHATPATMYCSFASTNVNISKSSDAGTSFPVDVSVPSKDAGDRASFVPPLAMDPATSTTLYAATHRLWRTTNGGTNWAVQSASTDLTGGGTNTISNMAIAPSAPATIMVVTSDGRVQRSTDSGVTFTNVTAAPLPGRFATSVAIHPTDPMTAYVGFSGFDDGTPATPGHIFKTTDGGATWTNVTGNLPDTPVNAIAIRSDSPEEIYAGTDVGTFISLNGATPPASAWAKMSVGLPNAGVIDIKTNATTNLLAIATYGRSVFTAPLATGTGTVTLTVTKAGTGTGTVSSSPAGIDCGASCSASFNPGTAVTLTASAATDSVFSGWSGGGCTGTGMCTVTLNAATTVTATFATATSIPRLVNIATRGRVQPGANVLIAGFIIGGSKPKKVLVTARGPSVAVLPSEVPLLIANPKMTLYSGATPVATNDDWQTLETPPSGSPVTLLSPNDIPATQKPGSVRDAAIFTTLAPGAYTAIVAGVNDETTGLAIVEVFEADSPDVPLINIATRGKVETGANVMIAGFIIQGEAPKKVLVTARGPSVAVLPSEVPLLMTDPKVTLYSGATPVASNDDWQTLITPPSGSPVTLLPPDQIPATQRPGNGNDAAILTTLAPGAYTAIVEGVGGASGIAIVEVFAQ